MSNRDPFTAVVTEGLPRLAALYDDSTEEQSGACMDPPI